METVRNRRAQVRIPFANPSFGLGFRRSQVQDHLKKQILVDLHNGNERERDEIGGHRCSRLFQNPSFGGHTCNTIFESDHWSILVYEMSRDVAKSEGTGAFHSVPQAEIFGRHKSFANIFRGIKCHTCQISRHVRGHFTSVESMRTFFYHRRS